MVEPLDIFAVRRPGPMIRLLGGGALYLGCISLGYEVVYLLSGQILAIVLALLGLAPAASVVWYGLLLALLRWELVIDRQFGTLTRRAWFLRTLWEERHRLDEIRAVELRRVSGGQPGAPGVFAVVLAGPGLEIDLDDPGTVPAALLFRVLARLTGIRDRLGRLALARSIAEFSGLELRDETVPADPGHAFASRAASPLTTKSGPVLVIPRIGVGPQVAAWVMIVAGVSLLVLLTILSPSPADRLEAAKWVLGMLAIAILPLLGLVSLAYRSEVVIDLPAGSLRNRGRLLGTRWDDRYGLDEFVAIGIREVAMPVTKSVHRTVELVGPGFEVDLYDDRNIPRALRAAERGLDRERRLVRSAERLAELCGLPLRVVRVG